MVFSTFYLVFRFLPLVFLLYYLTPRRGRNVVLFLFSLFFYAWGEPKYVFLMLFSITMDYTSAVLLTRPKKGKPEKAKGQPFIFCLHEPWNPWIFWDARISSSAASTRSAA